MYYLLLQLSISSLSYAWIFHFYMLGHISLWLVLSVISPPRINKMIWFDLNCILLELFTRNMILKYHFFTLFSAIFFSYLHDSYRTSKIFRMAFYPYFNTDDIKKQTSYLIIRLISIAANLAPSVKGKAKSKLVEISLNILLSGIMYMQHDRREATWTSHVSRVAWGRDICVQYKQSYVPINNCEWSIYV